MTNIITTRRMKEYFIAIVDDFCSCIFLTDDFNKFKSLRNQQLNSEHSLFD